MCSSDLAPHTQRQHHHRRRRPTPLPTLAPGAVSLRWRLVSADGHPITGRMIDVGMFQEAEAGIVEKLLASAPLDSILPPDTQVLWEKGMRDIGARRLQTVMERLLEEISFEAEDHAGETIMIDPKTGLRLGAAERVSDRIRRVQLEGTRYATRPPIGDPDVIQTAKREQLVRFYRDWYRPDLMAVIVVGDVQPAAVVEMITSHFGSLVNPTPARPRPAFDVPERPDTRYLIITDKETTTTTVTLSNLRPARPQDSVGGYRQIMMDQLFGDMLASRLEELEQKENPPFLRVGAGRGLFPAPRTKDEAVLQALVSQTPNPRVQQRLDKLKGAAK